MALSVERQNVCSMPRGVALVRVQIGKRHLFASSDRLTPEQRVAARAMATTLFVAGHRAYIMVSMTDLLALLSDAA